jgi:hypothetical protein
MDKKNTPMDDGAPESKTPAPSTNSPRACYAIKTLVAEFRDLFPETGTELSNYDGRNTALAVTFDLTGIAEEEHRTLATSLLELLNDPAHNEDRRIEYVLVEDEHALVTMRANPRTQDSREPFGLVDAFHVLVGDEDDMAASDEYEDRVLSGAWPHIEQRYDLFNKDGSQ